MRYLPVFMILSGSFAVAEPLEYNRDVRPILAENCFACHGPDSAARKGDLRIDKKDAAVEKKAIVPGQPDESELILRILSDDPEEVMPPAATKKVLTDKQKEILRRWIAEGAEYQPHWSFIAPVKVAPPAVKNEAWIRNPIDRFVLARLEAEGLEPAKEADRNTLARRWSLDLTGLPPKPEDLEEFLKDQSPDAEDKYLDKLFNSPEWGEHRGRFWLDAARYADTHGIHFDNYREVWVYREWVIRAFNSNMPFDQFTIEQLAGDLLPNPSLDQQVASGFNRCNITTNEGGVIPEEYLVHYTRDRTETTSQIWLGLTANCAVCHDHKFDPLSQREFYEMAAFFNNTTQGAMDGNIKDTPPIIPVPLSNDRTRYLELEKEVPLTKQQVEERRVAARPEFEEWLKSAKPDELGAAAPSEGLYLKVPLSEGNGKKVNLQVEGKDREVTLADSASWQPGVAGGGSLQTQGSAFEQADIGDFERDQAISMSAWVKLPANDGSGAICARMNEGENYRGWDFWVQRRQVGTHIINSWPGDAVKVVGRAQIPANEWTHVTVTYDGSSKAAGVKVYYNGKLQETDVEADTLKSTIKTGVPFKLGQRHESAQLAALQLSDLKIYKRALSESEVTALANSSRFREILAKAADQRTDAEKNELYTWWLGTKDETFQLLTKTAADREREFNDIRARGTVAHIMTERAEEPMAFILYRGEYDKRRDPVKADTPEILPPFPTELPKNRLGFAKWLLDPKHPLTARVTVNRFWQEVFGAGIVRTSGDFGVSGELPTHPELLDWLALEFREQGWDVRKQFKLMLTSATYRQAARSSTAKLEKDPQNRLYSRGPRFRMDAEMVRDYALASSGILVRKIGGPSVRPYQPDGVWEAVAMIGSNTRDYRADSGENLYRRSMYTFWKRSAPPASMEIFNAPNRETCTVRRERTNTPLQALVTLNDPQFVEAAKYLVQNTLKTPMSSDEERIDYLTLRIMSRKLQPKEMAIVRQSLEELKTNYKEHPEDAKALLSVGEMKLETELEVASAAAWTMLVNELLNLDEVLNK